MALAEGGRRVEWWVVDDLWVVACDMSYESIYLIFEVILDSSYSMYFRLDYVESGKKANINKNHDV